MNKLTLALALGAASAFGVPAPSSTRAATIATTASPIQTLATPDMSAAQFNSLFTADPNAPVLSSNYQFLGSPVTGTVRSQVFDGTGAAAGLYAYAYQYGVNPVNDASGNPAHLDSISYQFNATPTGADLTGLGHNSYAYAIKDGAIGQFVPPVASPGGMIMAPNTLSWQPGSTTGVIRASYVDPATQTQPLSAGADSATYIILSNQPFTQQYVNLQSSSPVEGPFSPVYSASGGAILPVPVPEPSTLLAWAGMVGAVLVARRVRGRRRVMA